MAWALECIGHEDLNRGYCSLLTSINTAEGYWEAKGCSCVRVSDWGLTLCVPCTNMPRHLVRLFWNFWEIVPERCICLSRLEIVLSLVGDMIQGVGELHDQKGEDGWIFSSGVGTSTFCPQTSEPLVLRSPPESFTLTSCSLGFPPSAPLLRPWDPASRWGVLGLCGLHDCVSPFIYLGV